MVSQSGPSNVALHKTKEIRLFFLVEQIQNNLRLFPTP
jgi:hypothetical protein